MAPERAGNADVAVSPSLEQVAAYLPADVLPQTPSKLLPFPFLSFPCRNWVSWNLGTTQSLRLGKISKVVDHNL